MASLLLRSQQRAVPASELDASVPKGLSDIVGKCLERDLDLRYQSAQEILADLDAVQGKRLSSASVMAQQAVTQPAFSQRVPWKWIAAALVLALGIGGWALVTKLRHKTETTATTAPA